MSFIRASLLLPACLHVSVRLEGVIVVIGRVVRGMPSGTVVLPLGLTQQLLLRTSQARRDRQREAKRGFQGKWGRAVCKVCVLWKRYKRDSFVDMDILCVVWKGNHCGYWVGVGKGGKSHAKFITLCTEDPRRLILNIVQLA